MLKLWSTFLDRLQLGHYITSFLPGWLTGKFSREMKPSSSAGSLPWSSWFVRLWGPQLGNTVHPDVSAENSCFFCSSRTWPRLDQPPFALLSTYFLLSVIRVNLLSIVSVICHLSLICDLILNFAALPEHHYVNIPSCWPATEPSSCPAPGPWWTCQCATVVFFILAPPSIALPRSSIAPLQARKGGYLILLLFLNTIVDLPHQ